MLEETDKVDMVVPRGDHLLLIITDAGITENAEERASLFKQKLLTYATYLDSPEFESDHPGMSRDRVSIKVMYRTPPPAEMQRVTSVTMRSTSLAVPVEFEHFPGR